jgi:hypothetical protein
MVRSPKRPTPVAQSQSQEVTLVVQDDVTQLIRTLRQAEARKQCYQQNACAITRSTAGCKTSEKGPLWTLLTGEFQGSLHSPLDGVRGLTPGHPQNNSTS